LSSVCPISTLSKIRLAGRNKQTTSHLTPPPVSFVILMAQAMLKLCRFDSFQQIKLKGFRWLLTFCLDIVLLPRSRPLHFHCGNNQGGNRLLVSTHSPRPNNSPRRSAVPPSLRSGWVYGVTSRDLPTMEESSSANVDHLLHPTQSLRRDVSATATCSLSHS
jgi:hypothetical protein